MNPEKAIMHQQLENCLDVYVSSDTKELMRYQLPTTTSDRGLPQFPQKAQDRLHLYPLAHHKAKVAEQLATLLERGDPLAIGPEEGVSLLHILHFGIARVRGRHHRTHRCLLLLMVDFHLWTILLIGGGMRRGMARRGSVRGSARREWQGEWQGGNGEEGNGEEGMARRGMARRGIASRGTVRRGIARRGMARRGKWEGEQQEGNRSDEENGSRKEASNVRGNENETDGKGNKEMPNDGGVMQSMAVITLRISLQTMLTTG
ncbi:hypothetical protein BS47DRAFT_1368123 [Hydnum rufescens UP504]|uniref:Uncharacterized protein n=1 Tax=Hydnum rufescens UP504 TaxID=1448309 RepID=A0A9P6AGC0_9AGAM|nr:hypothetical protein BS47DRAFT_1368123 [Hydnum rufescens UP504]